MNLDPSAFVAAPDLIQALDEHALPIPCKEEFLLFRQGDTPTGLFILKEGTVSLQMSAPDGHFIVSVEASRGSLLGLPGIISNQPYTLTAIAHAGALIGYVSRTDFTALMQSQPTLSLKILQVLAAEVSSVRRGLVEM